MKHRTQIAVLRLMAALLSALLALTACALAEAAGHEPGDAAGADEAAYTVDLAANQTLFVCQGDVVAIDFHRSLAEAPLSDDPTIAEVADVDLSAGTARVRAVGVGKAKITARLSARRKVRLTLNVTPPSMPADVRFPWKKLTLTAGESLSLTPEYTPATASPTFTWISSSPRVASVSEDGTVTAPEGAQGTARITAIAQNGSRATVIVKVVNPNRPKSVAFKSERFVMRVGETASFAPVLSPASARSTYAWRSSKPEVASVDDEGRVTARAAGHTKLTVRTSNGLKAMAVVEVVAQPSAGKG